MPQKIVRDWQTSFAKEAAQSANQIPKQMT